MPLRVSHEGKFLYDVLPVVGEPSSGGIQSLMNDGSVRLADTRQTDDSGYGNPSSFQVISRGDAEGSSRLFVGNLTYDSHDSAVQPSDWFVL
jgi:hypothetical protein